MTRVVVVVVVGQCDREAQVLPLWVVGCVVLPDWRGLVL